MAERGRTRKARSATQQYAAWRRAYARFETAPAHEIARAERRLLAATDRLMSAPIQNIADLELKISALLEMAATLVGDATEFPWRQLHRVVGTKRDVR
jgi:hypothetical protein